MSNSNLVTYKKISPNSSNPRRSKISKITIHHIAGNISLQTLGNVFTPRSRQASSNYGVDNNGNVGLYVDEKNRAWTSGSPANDHQAVTVEVANSRVGGNWPVSDKALEGTINLCVDICKRNGIKSLNYTGDSRGNLTRHNMFQNTNCPGPYLQSKFPYIASEVNKRLNSNVRPTSPLSSNIKVGDKVTVKKSATKYATGQNISAFVKGNTYTVDRVEKDRVLLKEIISWVKITDLVDTSPKPISPPSNANIAVDGYWGPATTRALQKSLGTPIDGVISGQYRNAVTNAIPSVSFGTSGSSMVRALQRKVGTKADGYIGPNTIRSLQKYLGTYQDGIISRPSNAVKEMQRKLNSGTF